MTRRLVDFSFVVALAGSMLAGCSSDPYSYETWTKQLDDTHTSERAVTELEQLGNPGAIPALGKAWAAQGKPVRLLQVIISLARPMTKAEATEKFFTDYEATGREASWDKALPFLKQAIDEIDENNPRSVDSAQKAAGALGEAGLAEGLESLITLTQKPTSKKIIAAQIDAIRALGKMEAEKAKATAALEKILDRDPPQHPRSATAVEKASVSEKFGLFLGMAGATVNALGELHTPSATKTLVLALYRTPELFVQIRRALVALGPTAKQALRDTLQGKYQPVTDLFAANHYGTYCGDSNELKGADCREVSAKDFYPAVVLGDFYDPEAVPDLLAALDRPPLPVYYQAKNPSPNTQHNAIFDSLRKIGSPKAADKVRSLWMGKAVAAPAAPGKPAPKAEEVPISTRILAASTYAFVTRDTQGIKELGVIAGTNKADNKADDQDWDDFRTETATAFARLANTKADVDVLLVLSKKYLDESNKTKAETDAKGKGGVSPRAEAEAADKEFAVLQKANTDAKALLQKATHDPSFTAAQIKDATKQAKDANLAYEVGRDEHQAKTGTFKNLEARAKFLRQVGRVFQTHAARIEVALRCGSKLDCYAATLKLKPEDSVANLKGYIKDENGKDEDLTKWTKEEKLGLMEGEVERAMLELGKAGPAAAQYADTLLDAAKSDDRLIRQSILLALPKIAKVPCSNCEAKLDAAIKAGEGKVTLGDLVLETTMLRNYFAWAGGKTPSKVTPEEAAKAAEPAKEDKAPAKAEEPAKEDKKEEPAKAEPAKAEPAKAEPAKPPAKADPKKAPAVPKKKGK